MEAVAIKDLLQQQLGVELEWCSDEKGVGDPFAVVPAEKWLAACRLARDHEQLQFNYLRALSGVDRPQQEAIEVVAHLFSYARRHALVLKTRAQRSQPVLASVSGVWPAAEWYEREIFDLLGVEFRGHRDLRRIMMPDDWPGHPLRKDYRQPDDYHGIPTRRPGPGGQAND